MECWTAKLAVGNIAEGAQMAPPVRVKIASEAGPDMKKDCIVRIKYRYIDNDNDRMKGL